MAAVELATGYVTLTVETGDLAKQIGRSFSGAEQMARDVGTKMGKSISRSLDNNAPSLDQLKRNVQDAADKVESAENRIAEAAKRATATQEASAAKVKVANTQVEKAVRDRELATVKLASEEAELDRLQKSGEASAKQLEAATIRVQRARNEVADKTDKVAAAEDKARVATAKHGDAMKISEQQIQLLNGELKEAKNKLSAAESAMKDAENTAEKTSQGIKGAFAKAFEKLDSKLNFRKAFSGADDAAAEAGRRSSSKFSEAFKGTIAGLGAYVGAREILGGIGQSINAAGQLEQSIGAVDAVFKENSRQMHAWAADSAVALGISTNEYNMFASVLGASLKNAGTPMNELGDKTNWLITLGADLASMYGGTTAEALEAISAALRGEMDPIEKYGISLNDAALTAEGLAMGIEKTGGAFTTQQKQLITQSLLLKQSADAQGNFMREQDTFAHKQQVAAAQWENLKAAMGEKFLPVATAVMGWVTDKALPGFDDFSNTLGAGLETVKPFFNFLKDTSDWWGPFAIGIGIAASALAAYNLVAWGATAASAALASVWAVITSPITLTVTAIGLLIGALILAYNKVGWFRDLVDTAWAWIKDVISGFVDWWVQTAWPGIIVGLQAIGEWFNRLWVDYIQPVWAWIIEAIAGFLTWWNDSFVPGIQSAIDLVGQAFTWFFETIIQPIWAAILTVVSMAVAVIMTVLQGIVWLVQNVLGPVFIWLYETIIQPVWDWITARIQGFSDWFLNSFMPVIQATLDVLKQAWQWVWDKVSAVFTWITDKIQMFATWFVATLLPIVQLALENLKTGFQWLQDKVGAVWDWISNKIFSAWSWIQNNVLNPAINFLKNTLGGAFQWLADKVGAVWDWISDKISRVWGSIKNNILEPMGNFLQTTVVDFFNKAKDGIGEAWNKIRETVKKPVEFVVNTVINDGLIKNYNKLNDWWNGDDLDEVRLPAGFARGGIIPGYQSVKKDEVLTPMRRGEGVLVPEATRVLGANFVHGINHAANIGGVTGARRWVTQQGAASGEGAAVGHSTTASTSGAPPYGPHGIWGSFQQQISKAGRLFVPQQTFMGVNTERVAQAWMGRSALEIIAGSGSPSVSFHSGGAGTYGFNQGSQIFLQPSVPANLKQAVLIHELGHALSLHHTMNTGSIMHPLQAGPTWPSALDYGSLAAAWGRPGEGVKTYEGGGDGGIDILGWIADKLTSFTDKAISGAKNLFKDNKWVELPLGFAGKAIEDVINFAKEKLSVLGGIFGGGDSGGGTDQYRDVAKQALEMEGEYSEANLNALLRRMQQESGGNARAINNWDVNALRGDPSKGLMQVISSTFRAYARPGYDKDIYDPLSNILASIRYTKSRYGSVSRGWNRSGGYAFGGIIGEKPGLYDNGGLIREGLQLIDHRRSTPDYVLTDTQWKAMLKIADSAQVQQNNGGITIGAVYGLTGEEVAREIRIQQRKNEALLLR